MPASLLYSLRFHGLACVVVVTAGVAVGLGVLGLLRLSGHRTMTVGSSFEPIVTCYGPTYEDYSGTVTSAKIAANGRATIKTKNLILERMGPCYYKFGTVKLMLSEGLAVGETLVVAKLSKAASSKACASTQGFAVQVAVAHEYSFRDLYEMVVTP